MKKALSALFIAALLCHAASSGWVPAADETRAGMYDFEKLGGSAAQPVKILLCPEVTCSSHTDFATVTADSYSAPIPAGVARPYFLIERNNEKRIIGARHLALAGAYNFRDLGGISTADGKTVRWGKVFRSDTLTRLTPADYDRLNAMGIKVVCDLRTRDERRKDPTEWQKGSPLFVLAPVSEDTNGNAVDGATMAKMLSGGMTLEEGMSTFEAFYVGMIFDSAAKFGSVLRAIEYSDGAAIFHCTGGRDRTGITAALLLHILGVPQETITQDFLLSTRYLSEQPAGITSASMPRLNPENAKLFAQVIELRPRYVEALFKAIDQRYGSFDRYRREALHLSDADVAALKVILLE
jgi:protein-tyrosine phosphatase